MVVVTRSLPALRPSRRELFAMMTASAFGSSLIASPSGRLRAVAFDAFVLFDPRTIMARGEEVAGDHGRALVMAASSRLFASTWYYTAAGRYLAFDSVAADAFRDSAQALGIELSGADLAYLVDGYSNLPVWPDVPVALDILRRNGVRLAILSNLPERTLRRNLRSAGIDRKFEFVLSTDSARKFKPAPQAYELGLRAFGLSRSQIGFAASAGWDAAGATWFGYPTVWVNRGGARSDEALPAPRIICPDMKGILQLVDWGTVAGSR